MRHRIQRRFKSILSTVPRLPLLFSLPTLSAGETTNALSVTESTQLSINTYNTDTDQLIWQSGDFGAAAGLRPIIMLVDHFGPSPEHRGLYVTPIGLFPFANESLPSALSFIHLIPTEQRVDIYSRAVSNSIPSPFLLTLIRALKQVATKSASHGSRPLLATASTRNLNQQKLN